MSSTVKVPFIRHDGTYATGDVVSVFPALTPHFLFTGGAWVEQAYGARSVTLTGASSHDVLTLPDGGDTIPQSMPWDIHMPSGTIWRVTFPPGDTGTYTIAQLLQAGKAALVVPEPPLDPVEAIQGPAGPPLVGRGTWNSSTAYDPYDVVFYVGQSYFATVANIGVTPGTSLDWQELTVAGVSGATALSGASGTAPLTLVFDPSTAVLTGAVAGATTSAPGVIQLALSSTDVNPAHVIPASDSRLSDARVPLLHAPSHQLGGLDQLMLDASQIGSGVIAGARLPLETGSADTTAGHLVTAGDTRLTDNRAPLFHAASHLAGGTDPISWVTVHGMGLDSAKPTAGPTNAGYFWFSTDVNGGTLFRSTGTTWTALLSVSGSGGGGAMNNPMTLLGDMIFGGTVIGGVATPTRLPIASQPGALLQTFAGLPAWSPSAYLQNPYATDPNAIGNTGDLVLPQIPLFSLLLATPPTVVPSGTGGSLAAGAYHYAVSWVQQIPSVSSFSPNVSGGRYFSGAESEAQLVPAVATTTTGTSAVTLTLPAIPPYPGPAGTSSNFNGQIGAWRLYRTKVNGSDYYWLKDVVPAASGATVVSDTLPDGVLGSPGRSPFDFPPIDRDSFIFPALLWGAGADRNDIPVRLGGWVERGKNDLWLNTGLVITDGARAWPPIGPILKIMSSNAFSPVPMVVVGNVDESFFDGVYNGADFASAWWSDGSFYSPQLVTNGEVVINRGATATGGLSGPGGSITTDDSSAVILTPGGATAGMSLVSSTGIISPYQSSWRWPPLPTNAGAPTDALFAGQDFGAVDGLAVVDTTNSKLWVRVNGTWLSTGPATRTVSAHSASYAIVSADLAATIEATAASLSFTLPDPASVGSGWWVIIKNVNETTTGVLTSAAGVLIDGVDHSATAYTTGLTSAYGAVGFQTDGSNWITFSGNGTGTGGGGSATLAGLSDVLLTSPTDAQLLGYNASAGKWENIADPGGGGGTATGASVNKVQLNYTRPTDVTGLSLPNGSWEDVTADQTFTVDDGQSSIDIAVAAFALAQNISTGVAFVSQLLIDGTTAYPLGGFYQTTAEANVNPFAGASPVRGLSLSAGSHTVRIQVKQDNGSGTGAFYCRHTTFAYEFMQITVVERKVVPTGASGTLDMVRYHQATGQSVNFNAAPTIINFDTQDWDTTSLVTTGAAWKFTAQKPGKYRLTTVIDLGPRNWNSNVNGLSIYKNGAQYCILDQESVTGTTPQQSVIKGSDEISLAVGDYLDVRVVQQAGSGAAITLSSAVVVIERADGYAVNTMTTAGDMQRGTTGGAPERVPSTGVQGSVWTTDSSGIPGWNGLQVVSAALSADATLGASQVLVTVLSLALGPGTWIITGGIAAHNTAGGSDHVGWVINDGSTNVRGGGMYVPASEYTSGAIAAKVVLAAAATVTLKCSAAVPSSTVLAVAGYAPSGVPGTYIDAVKVL